MRRTRVVLKLDGPGALGQFFTTAVRNWLSQRLSNKIPLTDPIINARMLRLDLDPEAWKCFTVRVVPEDSGK
jgi:hypothetical protein